MSLLAVIPARLASTRLPNKPLADLGGAPLVVRVWERVVGLAVADACVVATDDDRVADAVRSAGGHAVLTRAAHPSGTDRVAEVAGRAEFAGYDTIVNVQGDEPFVSGEVVRATSGMVARREVPIATAAVRDTATVLASPDVVKVVVDDRGRALLFSRASIPFLRDGANDADRAARDAMIRRHVGVYAYTREALLAWVALPVHPLERIEKLEQLRPLAHGVTIGVATVADAGGIGVDTPDDLARANVRYQGERAGGHVPPAHVAGPVDPGRHSATPPESLAPTTARPEVAR